MEDLTRGSDIAALSTSLTNTQRLLREAADIVGRWQVNFDVEIVPQTMSIKIVARKANGAGIIKTIEFGDIEYYSTDPDTLVQMIVADVYDVLLRQELTNELAPTLTRAIANCMRMKSK